MRAVPEQALPSLVVVRRDTHGTVHVEAVVRRGEAARLWGERLVVFALAREGAREEGPSRQRDAGHVLHRRQGRSFVAALFGGPLVEREPSFTGATFTTTRGGSATATIAAPLDFMVPTADALAVVVLHTEILGQREGAGTARVQDDRHARRLRETGRSRPSVPGTARVSASPVRRSRRWFQVRNRRIAPRTAAIVEGT
ncbi:hypothetical protein WMF27_43810 [Sorangium sp. So ce281]|uniref:hypothetical protein n=1 Tax=unclassified Sorangium TaxID=2621164 RepID=UPI003F603B05